MNITLKSLYTDNKNKTYTQKEVAQIVCQYNRAYREAKGKASCHDIKIYTQWNNLIEKWEK